MAAQTLKNLSGFQRGVESDEVGINIERIEVRIFPNVKVKLPDKDDEPRGFAVSATPSREVTIQGEINSALGVMAAAFATALVLVNDVDYFGSSTGGLYPDEATVVQGRGEWKNLSMKLSSDPGIA